jgi:hypothetical protein
MTDVRLTGHLTDTLAAIARWYPPTADPPRHQLGQDVAALTSFLAAHAEWLAGFDGDYAAHELGNIAYRLEQVVRQTTPARVKRIAPCPETNCPGTLEAIVRKEDDLLPSHVYCSADRAHTWAPEEWRALRRRLEALLDVAG